MINDKIKEKQKEIDSYQEILKRYGVGRWRNLGIRHLKSLKDELAELIDKQNIESE